jgi:oxygen-independent coproporphyrinogen-3 oxidase
MATAIRDRKKMCREATDEIMCAYIQIPFCRTLCRFCCWANKYDAKQILGLRDLREPYLAALKREIIQRSQLEHERERVDLKVIHFGGGTPSLLSTEELGDIVETLLDAYGIPAGSVETVGIEVRPDSVDLEKLRALRKIGFNRISIGAQTFDEEILRRVGRHLSPEELRVSFNQAREAGFDDINIDLLFGLPGQTLEIARQDAMTVAGLSPEHIDAHPWKPVATVGGECLMEGGWPKALKVRVARMQKEIFEDHGYVNYNHRCFSKPGYENLMHLIEATYLLPPLAFGAGSAQYTGLPKTTMDIDEYIAEDFKPDYMKIEPFHIKIEEYPGTFTDYVIRQLLLPEGLWVPGFNKRHDCDVVDRLKNGWLKDYSFSAAYGDLYIRSRLQIFRMMQKWLEEGIIKIEGDWLRLDPEHQISEKTWVLYMQAC